MLNGLDLFSGIGGITMALAPWVRPIAYCENDKYAMSVLLSRMSEGLLPIGPIWDDVRTLKGSYLPSAGVDIIYGGFPCQDISTAGNGAGLEGERSGLVYEVIRLAEEILPLFIFLENVPAIRTRGLNQVGKKLASIGYDCRWEIISASEVGAWHERKRWFLLARFKGPRELADTHGELIRSKQVKIERIEGKAVTSNDGQAKQMAHPLCQGLERASSKERDIVPPWEDQNWWIAEPSVGRVVHGISNRMDRIKSLGNSVVPIQAREAFKKLMGLKKVHIT